MTTTGISILQQTSINNTAGNIGSIYCNNLPNINQVLIVSSNNSSRQGIYVCDQAGTKDIESVSKIAVVQPRYITYASNLGPTFSNVAGYIVSTNSNIQIFNASTNELLRTFDNLSNPNAVLYGYQNNGYRLFYVRNSNSSIHWVQFNSSNNNTGSFATPSTYSIAGITGLTSSKEPDNTTDDLVFPLYVSVNKGSGSSPTGAILKFQFNNGSYSWAQTPLTEFSSTIYNDIVYSNGYIYGAVRNNSNGWIDKIDLTGNTVITTTIVNNLLNEPINGISIGYINNIPRIFFLSSREILRRCDTDGSNLSVVNFGLTDMYGHTVVANDGYLYTTNNSVSSGGVNNIVKLNTSSTTKINESLLFNSSSLIGTPTGIVYYNGDLYTANQSTNNVTKISMDGTITIIANGISNAYGLASNDSGLLFVSRNNSTQRQIQQIDLNNNNTVTSLFQTQTDLIPYGLAVDKTKTYLVVCNFSSSGIGNQITIYNLNTEQTVKSITVSVAPISVVFDDFNRLYVLCQGGKVVIMFNDFINSDSYTSVVSTGLNAPRYISLDYNKEIFYISDSRTTGQQIYKTIKKINYLKFANTLNVLNNVNKVLYQPERRNSNATITFVSSNELVATISRNDLNEDFSCYINIIGLGTCNITCTQNSNEDYMSSSAVTILTVSPSQQNPTLSFSIDDKIYGIAPFKITPPTSNSNGSFSYTSSNLSVATISNDIVTILKPGITKITATQSSTQQFTSATIEATLNIIESSPSNPTPTNTSEDLAYALQSDTTFITINTEILIVTGDLVNTSPSGEPKSIITTSQDVVTISL